MKRIDLKARSYSPAQLEEALREAVQSLGDEQSLVVQCANCKGWFVIREDDVREDAPPRREGRFWKIERCAECLREDPSP